MFAYLNVCEVVRLGCLDVWELDVGEDERVRAWGKNRDRLQVIVIDNYCALW